MSSKIRTIIRFSAFSACSLPSYVSCVCFNVYLIFTTQPTLLTTISEYSIFVDLLCHKWFDKLLCYQQICLPYKLFHYTIIILFIYCLLLPFRSLLGLPLTEMSWYHFRRFLIALVCLLVFLPFCNHCMVLLHRLMVWHITQNVEAYGCSLHSSNLLLCIYVDGVVPKANCSRFLIGILFYRIQLLLME